MPGPVTAVVIGNSSKSPYAGLVVALGHAVIELPLILFLAIYAGNFMEIPLVRTIIFLGGGLMLIYLGIQMILSSNKENKIEASHAAAFKGGIMTTINPYFFIWWATVGLTLILKSLEFSRGLFIAMILVHFSVDTFWNGLLGLLTYKSGVLTYPKAKHFFYIFLGICLFSVAAYFIINGLKLLAA